MTNEQTITITPELIEKARSASSAAEIIEIARAEGIEMESAEAESLFATLHAPDGELSDEELEAVAGGGCGDRTQYGQNYCPGCGGRDYHEVGWVRFKDTSARTVAVRTKVQCNVCGTRWVFDERGW